MTHYGTATNIRPKTDNDWLLIGSYVGELVNDWADRHDLVAYVGEVAGIQHGAPALYNPRSAEIQVNTNIAFGHATPADVGNLRERSQHFEYPKAIGAIFHEAMHAKFSSWDLEAAARALTPGAYAALHLLEESRIEKLGIISKPENRVFLRACALEIVLGDLSDERLSKLSNTRQAAQAMALTSARVDAGILDPKDIILIRQMVNTIIPSERFDQFQALWLEFQTLNEAHGIERMYEIANEWEALTQETREENGEAQDAQFIPDPNGESSGGDDEEGEEGEDEEGEDGNSSFAEDLKQAIEEAVEDAGITIIRDLEEQKTHEDYKEEVESRSKKNDEAKDHKSISGNVFGVGTGPSDASTSSRLRETRKPTLEERVSAVTIAKALEKAQYQDRVRTEKASELPPGRLRSRALVQGLAQRERGLMSTTEPFKRISRHHVDDPNLTIGVMVDISGSMNSAMEPMASAAWILSEAVRRVQGTVAMTYYGSDVFATLKPGQHLTDVKVYSASDSVERFDKSFKALDGALNLLNSSGARMLVIVSDGQYVDSEERNARKWIARCEQAGVGVLWIGAGSYGGIAESMYCTNNKAAFARMKDSATGVADEIGRRAIEAIEKASSRI